MKSKIISAVLFLLVVFSILFFKRNDLYTQYQTITYVSCVNKGGFTILNVTNQDNDLVVHVNYQFADNQDYEIGWGKFIECSNDIPEWSTLTMVYVYLYPITTLDDNAQHIAGKISFGLLIPRKNSTSLTDDNLQDVKDGKISFYKIDYGNGDYNIEKANGDGGLAVRRFLEYIKQLNEK